MNATPSINARIARRNSIIAAFDAAHENLQTANRRVESALNNADRADKNAALVRDGGTPTESALDDMRTAASKTLGWRAYDMTAEVVLPYYIAEVAENVKTTAAAQDAARAAFQSAEKAYNRLRF